MRQQPGRAVHKAATGSVMISSEGAFCSILSCRASQKTRSTGVRCRSSACLEDGVQVMIQAVVLDRSVSVAARVERHLPLVEGEELPGPGILAQL